MCVKKSHHKWHLKNNIYIIYNTMQELYDTEFLLERLFNELGTRNITKIKLDKPQIELLNKKTYISNCNHICSQINRDPEDLKTFVENELKISASITGDKKILLNGTFKPKVVIDAITNYILKYVHCTKDCGSFDTKIITENRIKFLYCNVCHSKRSI